ncbi:unnamed protein product [Dovyalis caffra]|uniref:Endonuclease/exonuclease/phosphatase domain-containing protein n=1 Tax=Dovyalis caffra TaxID=77055 RepID=A0AAV1RQ53_9ROSI|nr:unnamed protein product [Dovyalis caffra]
MLGVYAISDINIRCSRLFDVVSILNSINGPFSLMGNFNDILSFMEKQGGQFGEAWSFELPLEMVYHLDFIGSDHKPLLLDSQGSSRRIIRRAWNLEVMGSKWYKVLKRIRERRMQILDWRKKANVNSRKQIEEARAHLTGLMAWLEGFSFDRVDVLDAEIKLKKAWLEEEKYWRTKSRN